MPRCTECGLGEHAGGSHDAIDRVRPAQLAQVSEREQRVGADHDGQVAPELREGGWINRAALQAYTTRGMTDPSLLGQLSSVRVPVLSALLAAIGDFTR